MKFTRNRNQNLTHFASDLTFHSQEGKDHTKFNYLLMICLHLIILISLLSSCLIWSTLQPVEESAHNYFRYFKCERKCEYKYMDWIISESVLQLSNILIISKRLNSSNYIPLLNSPLPARYYYKFYEAFERKEMCSILKILISYSK